MTMNYAAELEACLRGARCAVQCAFQDAAQGLPFKQDEMLSCLDQIATLRGRLDSNRGATESAELQQAIESIRRSTLNMLTTTESSIWDIWRLAHRIHRFRQRPAHAPIRQWPARVPIHNKKADLSAQHQSYISSSDIAALSDRGSPALVVSPNTMPVSSKRRMSS